MSGFGLTNKKDDLAKIAKVLGGSQEDDIIILLKKRF